MKDSFEKIYQIVAKFLIPLTVRDTYRVIIDEATKFTNADYGSVFLIKGKSLRRTYTTAPLKIRLQLKQRKADYMRQIFRTSRPFILTSTLLKKYHPEASPKIKSIVITPLLYRKKPTGVFTSIFIKRSVQKSKLETMTLYGYLAS